MYMRKDIEVVLLGEDQRECVGKEIERVVRDRVVSFVIELLTG